MALIEKNMTRKEQALTPPPLLYMFEQILGHKGLFMDSKNWRDCERSMHIDWLKPLLDMGAIEETGTSLAWPAGAPKGRRQFKYHKYSATPIGLEWWAKEATARLEAHHGNINLSILLGYAYDPGPLVGKGLKTSVRIWWWAFGYAAVKAIRDGYLTLVEFEPAYRGSPASYTVELTPKGLRFFDSLPRLEMECA